MFFRQMWAKYVFFVFCFFRDFSFSPLFFIFKLSMICICRYTSFSTIRNLAQTPLAHTITPVCVVLYYVGTLSPLATQPRHTRRASKLFYSSKLNNKDKKEAVVLYVMVIVNKPRAC